MIPALALLPLSAIYSALTRVRLSAYQRGWLSVSGLPVPVISVGNLTTGGTGKTPLVEWVCRTLAQDDGAYQGRKVCVLTRGYRRKNPHRQVLVSDGTALLASEREAGDEPLLLAKNLLGIAAVVANRDRSAAGKWARETLNTEVFVLDDGFQHLRLARDLDIVTIDATNPWGGGGLLPQGSLREPRAGLSRAGCVVLTRMEQSREADSVRALVRQLAGPIPIFSSRMVTIGIRTLEGESVGAETLAAQPLAAFCGVGNPASFFKHLQRAGSALVFSRAFADHHNYTQPDLTALVNQAKKAGARALVTTAKDAIKLGGSSLELPCYVLDIRIAIDDEARLAGIVRALGT